jgi:hypothetical protein
MRCPFCSLAISPNHHTGMGYGSEQMWYRDAGGHHRVGAASCPDCGETFLLHSDVSFGLESRRARPFPPRCPRNARRWREKRP